MPQNLKKITYWMLGVMGVVLLLWLLWVVFFSSGSSNPVKSAVGGLFGIGNSASFTVGGSNSSGVSSSTTVIPAGAYAGQVVPNQKIFKLADGPVVGATFVQTSNPTTTLARYTMANDGHTFDIPLDVPGAIARVVSNTTIPGLVSEQWLSNNNNVGQAGSAQGDRGSAMLVQYLEGGVVKTVYVGFPVASSTTAAGQSAPRVHFLPNNVTSVAVSPDGAHIAYLLQEGVGSGGYITDTGAFNDKKLFSLPLEELTLSWPTQSTLLVQSKPAAGVPGIAFSVSTKSGGTSLLVDTLGLSASANADFSKILYQKADGVTLPLSFVHDVATGRDASLPFNPFPERCVWSPLSKTIAVCAAPLASVAPNYLDLWHMGLAHSQDGIFSFDVEYGVTSLLALPGSAQGGVKADVAQVALSQDGKYLLYITRGDRSLWGVRLNP